MKNPKVTLAQVAERAGMSAATASRALRGLKVHRKYQGKAEAAAAALGYVLNESARSLRSVRTMTVGMVYYDLTSMLGMELLRAVAGGLDEIGYSLFVSTAQGRNDQFDKLVHRFLQRRVDALVCVHGNGQGPALEGYAAAGIPVMALISKQGAYSKLPMIEPSVDQAAKACVDRLRKLGHERALLLAPDRPIPAVDSILAAAKSKRLRLERVKVPETGFDAAAWLRKSARDPDRPTVAIALFAEAVRFLEAAKQAKVKIPEQMSLVALRDRSFATTPAPQALSTVHLDPAPMGKLASDVLKAWLVEGKALESDRKVEIGSWIERETTGPCPK